MTTTHKTDIYDMVMTMEADWAEASSTVIWCGKPTQWQVADFSHRPAEAMRILLAAEVAIGEGCSADSLSEDIMDVIDDAVRAMV